MNYRKILITLILILILAINKIYAQENKIILKIDNQIITSLDILNEIKYLKSINEEELKKIESNKLFEIAKNSLIREKIKEIELLKNFKKLVINKKYLNSFLINSFKKKNIYTMEEFENFFKNKNIEPKIIKQKIQNEILWNQLIYQKFFQNVKIDKDIIEKQLLNKKEKREFLISEIVFNIKSGEKLDEKYELIKDTIKNNNFSEGALIFSISNTANNGGKLGWIKETALSSKIKDKISLLNVGEISEPIKIPGAFLILMIENERKAKKELNTDEEMKTIVQKKTNDQLNQFSNIYFNKIKKDIIINEL